MSRGFLTSGGYVEYAPGTPEVQPRGFAQRRGRTGR